jgi:hypothetical protein
MTEEQSLLNPPEDDILRTPEKPPLKSRKNDEYLPSYSVSPLNLSGTEFHSGANSHINDNDDNSSSTQPLLHTTDTESNSPANANTSDFIIAPIDANKANRHVLKKKNLLNHSLAQNAQNNLALRAMELAAYYSRKKHLTKKQYNLVNALYTSNTLQKNSTDIDNAMANRRASFEFYALISQAKINIANLLLNRVLPQEANTTTHKPTLLQQCNACITLLDSFDHKLPVYKPNNSNQTNEDNQCGAPAEKSLEQKLTQILLSLQLPPTTNSFLLDPDYFAEKQDVRRGYIETIRNYFVQCKADKVVRTTLQNNLQALIKNEQFILSEKNQNKQNETITQLSNRCHIPNEEKKEKNLQSTSPSNVITASPMVIHLNSREDAQAILENGVDPLLKTLDGKNDLDRYSEAGNRPMIQAIIQNRISCFTTSTTCDTAYRDDDIDLFLDHVIDELQLLLSDNKGCALANLTLKDFQQLKTATAKQLEYFTTSETKFYAKIHSVKGNSEEYKQLHFKETEIAALQQYLTYNNQKALSAKLLSDKKPWFNKYSEKPLLLHKVLAHQASSYRIKVFEDTYAEAVKKINEKRSADKQLHPHFYLTIRSPMKEVWNDKLPMPKNSSYDGYTPIELAAYIRHFQQQHKNDAENTPIDLACSTLKRHLDSILEKTPTKQKYQRMAEQLKTWKTALKDRSTSTTIPDAVAYINTQLSSFKHIKNIKQRAQKSQRAITGFFAPNAMTTAAIPEYHLIKNYTPVHLRIERNQLRDLLASSNSIYNNIDQNNGHALNFINDAATYANCATGERHKSALDLSITYAKHDFNKTLEIKNKAIDALFSELLTHITRRKKRFLSNKKVLTKREDAVDAAKKAMKSASTLEEASKALVTLQNNTDIRKHLGFFDSITQRLHINKKLTTTHKKANQIDTSTIKSCFPG